MCSHLSADELFRIKDNKAPIGVEHAVRGLLKPFESLFPDSCVPSSEQEALEFITTPEKYAPTQPFDPEMKRDWINILWCEVQMRLEVAFRFMVFRSKIKKNAAGGEGRHPSSYSSESLGKSNTRANLVCISRPSSSQT